MSGVRISSHNILKGNGPGRPHNTRTPPQNLVYEVLGFGDAEVVSAPFFRGIL